MKCYVVSSRLFAPGHIMRPFRLEQERDALIRHQAELEKRLKGLPERIADLERQRVESLIDFTPLEGAEQKPT